jgi:hypothetical protein
MARKYKKRDDPSTSSKHPTDAEERVCLKCACPFMSTGNRICPRCTNVNRYWRDVFVGNSEDGIYS